MALIGYRHGRIVVFHFWQNCVCDTPRISTVSAPRCDADRFGVCGVIASLAICPASRQYQSGWQIQRAVTEATCHSYQEIGLITFNIQGDLSAISSSYRIIFVFTKKRFKTFNITRYDHCPSPPDTQTHFANITWWFMSKYLIFSHCYPYDRACRSGPISGVVALWGLVLLCIKHYLRSKIKANKKKP